jgi:hypothetical protein
MKLSNDLLQKMASIGVDTPQPHLAVRSSNERLKSNIDLLFLPMHLIREASTISIKKETQIILNTINW